MLFGGVIRSGLLQNFLCEEVGKKSSCPTNDVFEITMIISHGDVREILTNTTHKEIYYESLSEDFSIKDYMFEHLCCFRTFQSFKKSKKCLRYVPALQNTNRFLWMGT